MNVRGLARARITGTPGSAVAEIAMTDIAVGQRVGEVMMSHSQRIEAQCYELHNAPPLGALLRIGSPPVYAVVREIWNEPLDPSRPLAPRGSIAGNRGGDLRCQPATFGDADHQVRGDGGRLR